MFASGSEIAPLQIVCETDEANCACQLDGGTVSFDSGSLVCVLPDANSPTDAGGDADGHD
jgi:hypothetical protein